METSYRPRNAEETTIEDAAFDKALAVGQIVEVSWTQSKVRRAGGGAVYRFRTNARVEKVNRATVLVTTLEQTLHVPAGTVVYVPRWPWSRWPDKGVWPRSTHLVRIQNASGANTVRVPDLELAHTIADAEWTRARRVNEPTSVEIAELP